MVFGGVLLPRVKGLKSREETQQNWLKAVPVHSLYCRDMRLKIVASFSLYVLGTEGKFGEVEYKKVAVVRRNQLDLT